MQGRYFKQFTTRNVIYFLNKYCEIPFFLRLYFVNRRYPGSFWITASTFNKLATENVFDYYNHQSHSWAEYDNHYDDPITDQYLEYSSTEKSIEGSKIRNHNSCVKYLA